MKGKIKASLFLVIMGIVSIVVGIISIANGGALLESLTILFAVAILVSGVMELATALFNREIIRNPGWVLVLGLLDLAVGLMLLFNLGAATAVLPFVIGFWAMFASITRIAASVSFFQVGYSNWWVTLIAGIIGLVISFFIITNPVFGAFFITTYVGAYFIFWGISAVVESFTVKGVEAKIEAVVKPQKQQKKRK